jgi:hypothetical protein
MNIDGRNTTRNKPYKHHQISPYCKAKYAKTEIVSFINIIYFETHNFLSHNMHM